MQSVAGAYAGLLKEMPGAVIEAHAEGGVVIVPWSVTDEGRQLALQQQEAAVLAAKAVRARFFNHPSSRGFLTDMLRSFARRSPGQPALRKV
jgi:protein-L-isoaspartate O-methyltransferase